MIIDEYLAKGRLEPPAINTCFILITVTERTTDEINGYLFWKLILLECACDQYTLVCEFLGYKLTKGDLPDAWRC